MAENLEPPVAFWDERTKTGQPRRGHLTHECIEVLREYRKISDNERITPLTVDGLNVWIRSLAKKAKINSRGHIRFHLLRKYLFSALVNSGMSEMLAKIIVGKSVNISDLTYLQSLAPTLRQGYTNAHHKFALTGYTNSNHNLLKTQTQELEELRGVMKVIAKYIAKEGIKGTDRTPSMGHPIMVREGTDKLYGIGPMDSPSITEEDIKTLLEFIKPKEQNEES